MRLVLVVALVWSASLGEALAQTTCRPSGPFVTLELVGVWPEGERGAVTAELRAALATEDFELCLASRVDRQPVARVRLERRDLEHVLVAIGDAVTDKRVERELDLTSFTADAQPLAIAIAADELLRASWAELLLVDAPPPAMEPPSQVRAAVERSLPPSTRPEESDAWLELALPLERFDGGDLWLGASLRAERWWVQRVGVRLGLGARGALASDDVLGEVRGRSWAAELDVLVGLLGDPRRGGHLGLGAGTLVSWTTYRATPEPGVTANDASGLVLSLRGLAFARWTFGVVRLGVELGAGGALVGAAATANDTRVTGSHGLLLQGALTFGVRL